MHLRSFLSNDDLKLEVDTNLCMCRNRDDDSGADGEKTSRGWASSSNLSSNEPPKKDAFSTGQ